MSAERGIWGWAAATEFVCLCIWTASAAAADQVSPQLVDRDINVIAACVKATEELSHCLTVCDMKSSEPIVCAPSAHIEAVNEAIRRTWPTACSRPGVLPELMGPVVWDDSRSARVHFKIPAGPAGALGCYAHRNWLGRWSVRFGIRE